MEVERKKESGAMTLICNRVRLTQNLQPESRRRSTTPTRIDEVQDNCSGWTFKQWQEREYAFVRSLKNPN